MRWKAKEVRSPDLPSVEELSKHFALSRVAAQVLQVRMQEWSDTSLEAVARFLQPSLKNLPSPFLLKDMDKATDCVVRALLARQSIAVYGDYDVDGTCAAAILRRFFRDLDTEVILYQPDRVSEGYGLNQNAVKKLTDQGVKLLITVDCGISNASEVAWAKNNGVEVIVCDHHQVPPAMPEAAAVINHKREDDDSPIETLCGAGMSFYLAMAVRARLREDGYFADRKEPDVRQYLDLVALASVADIVPLLEETRILTSMGLKKMQVQPTLGIAAICERAGLNPLDLDSYHLGFVLGPRVNASGRLDSARYALDLLTTEDPFEAERLASRLEDLNKERIQLTQETFADAINRSRNFLARYGEDAPAIVIAADDWHEGVIGIVASRVQEEFHKPALLITFKTHNGWGKGSARAGTALVHVTEALQACSGHLEKFGGHQAAAGLSLKRENLDIFIEAFLVAVRGQLTEGKLPERERHFDALLELEELSAAVFEDLRRFAPFGQGNPEPILLGEAVRLKEMRVLKGRHLKMALETKEGQSYGGFWPNGAPRNTLQAGQEACLYFSPQVSVFRGKKSLELRIHDVQK